MNLTLVISNPARLLHGYLPSHRFNQQGGSIGSGACDWRLDDRKSAVQPSHCEIRIIEGRFCVIDRSSRTYVNGHDLPLERHIAVRLNEGDSLQIGEYRIVAHLHNHGFDDDDPRHLSQRSLGELLTGCRDGLEDWHADALPMVPPPDPLLSACPEFEQLCRPLGLSQERDPLWALEALLPTPPVRDVLDLPAHAQAITPIVECIDRVRPGVSRLTSNLRLVMLLLTCLTLGGCTMLGKVGQVIWNPSISVGGPDDQPSRYSLSLHASNDANLRMISPGTAPTSAEDPPRSPYTVNVQANSPQALTDTLQTLLNHLYETVPAQSLMAPDLAPALEVSPIEQALLGDYDAQGVSLSTPLHSTSAQQIATPIAFKVLQLTDDSLLINASAQALAEDLKKTLGSTYIRVDDYLLQPGQFKFVDLQTLDEDARFIAVIADYHSAEVAQWKQLLRVEPKGRQYAVLVQLDDSQVDLKGETR